MTSQIKTQFSPSLLGGLNGYYYSLHQPLSNDKPLTLIKNIDFLMTHFGQGWLCLNCYDQTSFSWLNNDSEVQNYFKELHRISGSKSFEVHGGVNCDYSIYLNRNIVAEMKRRFREISSELVLGDIYYFNDKIEHVFEAANFCDGLWAEGYTFSANLSKPAIEQHFRGTSIGVELLKTIDKYPYIDCVETYMWGNK